MDRGPMLRRMDFVIAPLVDQETGEEVLAFIPDPRRHQWREANGKRYLVDRLDDSAIEESVFLEGMKKLPKLPFYYMPPRIPDGSAYVASRRDIFRARLLGDAPPPSFASPSESFLRSIAAQTHDFVILSLDIVGSTQRATSQPLAEYATTMQAVLGEMAEVLPLFHGHVLKHTGDGILAYFAAPGFITMNDLGIDCALTLRRLVYEGFNPILGEMGRQELEVRIGLDSGTVAVVPLGSPSTKEEKDLLGEVVSLACKIQGLAPRGGIALGDVTFRNLHHQWRGLCTEIPVPETWSYPDPHSGDPYRVWQMPLVSQ